MSSTQDPNFPSQLDDRGGIPTSDKRPCGIRMAKFHTGWYAKICVLLAFPCTWMKKSGTEIFLHPGPALPLLGFSVGWTQRFPPRPLVAHFSTGCHNLLRRNNAPPFTALQGGWRVLSWERLHILVNMQNAQHPRFYTRQATGCPAFRAGTSLQRSTLVGNVWYFSSFVISGVFGTDQLLHWVQGYFR